jgi:hypothetical protein
VPSERERRAHAHLDVEVAERRQQVGPRVVAGVGVELVDGGAPLRRLPRAQLGRHPLDVVEQVARRGRPREQQHQRQRPHRQSLRCTPGIVEALERIYCHCMAFLQLGKILDGAAGVKKDGAAYLIPEEVDANAFVSLGQEVLQIQRLARVEVGSDVVKMQTHKNEVFWFPVDEIVGFKLGAPEKASRSHAGFGK